MEQGRKIPFLIIIFIWDLNEQDDMTGRIWPQNVQDELLWAVDIQSNVAGRN